MALEYNFYLTTTVGSGVLGDAYRSILYDEMIIANGEEYVDMHYPQRHMTFAIVRAEPSRHVVFQAITGVTRIIPIVSATAQQIRTNLDTRLTVLLTPVKITELRTALETNGINTEWADSSTTFRQVIRYLLRSHAIGQRLQIGGDLANSFLTANLTATVASIPAGARNRIAAWMTEQGLSTAWITGSTTVRQVLHYILMNLNHRRIRLMGEVF